MQLLPGDYDRIFIVATVLNRVSEVIAGNTRLNVWDRPKMAAAVVFLCSEGAAFMTGEVLELNGGSGSPKQNRCAGPLIRFYAVASNSLNLKKGGNACVDIKIKLCPGYLYNATNRITLNEHPIVIRPGMKLLKWPQCTNQRPIF